MSVTQPKMRSVNGSLVDGPKTYQQDHPIRVNDAHGLLPQGDGAQCDRAYIFSGAVTPARDQSCGTSRFRWIVVPQPAIASLNARLHVDDGLWFISLGLCGHRANH
jgi:hypothetical protein